MLKLTCGILDEIREDREVKKLRGKEIALVKVIWGGVANGNITWELEDKMRESYPELFV